MALTPQEQRKIRLKNDFREMRNIEGSSIEWNDIKGSQPHVEEYDLVINIRTIISSGPKYRECHKIKIILPENYPFSAPLTTMITKPQPFHPNWYPNGKWCYGYWEVSEGLGHHVIRMIRTLQFDPAITNPDSAANSKAKSWYLKNRDQKLFPCDHTVLPDPTSSRFKIIAPVRGRFEIVKAHNS